jgi:hypothetical protein
METTYFHLTEEDLKTLRETFKINEDKIGDYDRLLDGLKCGMVRLSRIKDNYGLGVMNEDALRTIAKLHGYNYETIMDIIFGLKKRGKND